MKLSKSFADFLFEKMQPEVLTESKAEKKMLDIMRDAALLWSAGTKLSGSSKVKVITRAEEMIQIGLKNYLSKIDNASEEWDKIDMLKKHTQNPLVMNILNQYQNSLRHSIKVQNW